MHQTGKPYFNIYDIIFFFFCFIVAIVSLFCRCYYIYVRVHFSGIKKNPAPFAYKDWTVYKASQRTVGGANSEDLAHPCRGTASGSRVLKACDCGSGPTYRVFLAL